MSTPNLAEQLRYFQKHRSEIVESIRQLVEIESPSDLKQAVDRLGTVLASRFSELGGRISVHHAEKFGNHLQADFKSSGKQKPILLLGHMDTVYPIGTISKMPCRVSKGRLYGPGVLDMKSGIALALHVLEATQKWHRGKLPKPITVLLVSDEEVGSKSSRAITERLAKQSSAVLVLEPAAGLNGSVKTARKGICEYALQVTGKAAHSGLDFEKGQNAIVELSRQIGKISELVDLKRGVTVNVGKVSGGTRVNVVPAEASAAIDVRVSRMSDALKIDRELRSLEPFNPKCRIKISGGMNRPPMERTAGVEALFDKAAAIAGELGWNLEEAAVGGGSDGNFTAAMGVPTLDGLGGVGEGAHAEHESILIAELPRRAALLSALIAGI